jgi:hypothetical protein
LEKKGVEYETLKRKLAKRRDRIHEKQGRGERKEIFVLFLNNIIGGNTQILRRTNYMGKEILKY